MPSALVPTTSVHTVGREKTCAEVRFNHEIGAGSSNDRHSQSHAVHLCNPELLFVLLVVSPPSRFCSFIGP
jgi:hypothetical protein